MKAPEEKGFLSHKFDNWESEPIPNGWNRIEKELKNDRRRGIPFWIWPALIGTLIGILALWKSYDGQFLTNKGGVSQEIARKPADQAKSLPGSAANNWSQETEKQTGNAGSLQTNVNSEVPPGTAGAGINAKFRHQNAIATSGLKVGASRQKTGIEAAKTASVIPGLNEKTTVRSTSTLGSTSDEAHSASPYFSKSESLHLSSPPDKQDESMTMDLNLMNTRQALLNLPEISTGEPLPYVKPPLEEKKKAGMWRYSLFFDGGILSRTFSIRQAEAVHHLKINNMDRPSDAYALQIGAQIRRRIYRHTEWFSSISIGQVNQIVRLENTAKSPVSYEMEHTHDLNFQVLPHWKKVNETQNRTLLFSMVETGLFQPLSSRKHSGLWASMVTWIRWSEKNTSDLDAGQFRNAESTAAVSYRIGYQHQISTRIQTKIFFSPMPESIFSQFSGLSIKPRWIGAGLHYQF